MIRSLEGLRGIAALIVALYHLGIGTQHIALIRNGYLFVDLFFVLSGFIMCAAYASRLSNTEDLRVFLVRRIGRLFPLLIFSTLVWIFGANAIVLAKRVLVEYGYAGALANPQALEWVVPTAKEILATLTFTHSLGVFDELILNTPSWSISVEFYAYVLFAALCLALAGRARLVAYALAGALGAAVTVWASINVHDCLAQKGCMSLTYDFGFARAVYSFFLGALTWHASRRMKFPALGMQIVALALLAFVFVAVDVQPALAFALPFVFALLILSVCMDAGPMSAMLAPRPFQLLGLWSYSIYLMHMPLLLVFENLARRADSFAGGLLIVVAFVVVLLAVSAWTYRYIEDPMRAWFNRFSMRSAVSPSRTHV